MNQPHPQHRRGLDQFELTSVKRMKRVRHPDELPLDASKGCT